ncbi:MAG: hypothetical protein ACOZNI_11615 [Myxococcota bacterium]
MSLRLGLLLLAGCGEPATFEDCGGAACRAAMALREWEADPAATAAKVAALPDELERTLIVEQLTEAHPGDTATLCERLPAGDAQRRCRKLNTRPHLGVRPPPTQAPSVARTAPGPALSVLPVAPLPLPAEPAAPDTCGEAAARGACVDGAARRAAREGHAGAVPEICARHAREPMRDECVFGAAEGVVEAEGAEGYARAAALCAAAGAFDRACHTHLLLYTVRARPRAEAMTADDVSEAARFAEAVHAAWAGDPATGDAHAGWFWARWLAGAYHASETVPGTPLVLLPEEARSHARAAAVARLQALGRLRGTLAERVAAAEAALAQRPEPVPDGVTVRPTQGRVGPVWGADATAADAATPAVWYLGADRRPVDPDPAVDLALCVVAAAAHAQPLDTALLAEASASETPVVARYAKAAARVATRGGRP